MNTVAKWIGFDNTIEIKFDYINSLVAISSTDKKDKEKILLSWDEWENLVSFYLHNKSLFEQEDTDEDQK